MAMANETFAEHAKWLAFGRNRFTWPKHWQVVIFKITRVYDPLWGDPRYSVLPANPDYQKYVDEPAPAGAFGEPPPMHLGPVVFDSMEAIDQWAAVAHRLR